jgi:uncharacterized protein YbcI
MPDTEHQPEQSRHGSVKSRISNGAVQLLGEYTGRGPTKAHTIVNRDSVTIILQDTLTKGEKSLVDAERSEEVLRTRHTYQEVMRDALSELVERATDRTVIAFMSANHIDPDVALEFFLLEPLDGAAEAA